MTESDLRDRLTKALMDAMGCKSDVSWLWAGSQFCARHKRLGWPCGAVTDIADALLPFVRDEVADEVDLANTETCAVLRRIWTDPKDREVVDAVEVLLEQRADEVRRG